MAGAHRTVGIIGGLGPGATADFYRAVVRRYAERHGGDQPALLLYSVPLAAAVEHALLHDGQTAGPEMGRMTAWLDEGVQRLARAGADAIVMPCNTLQAHLPQRVARSGLAYIHLIQATVAHIQQQGYQKVAVICTTLMRALGLYQAELEARAISYLLPTEAEQADITRALLDTLHPASDSDPSARLRPLVRRLETEADAILLACSDLTAFHDHGFTRLPVVDAMEVLAEATVRFLLSDGGSER
jgi:aspartate racemase